MRLPRWTGSAAPLDANAVEARRRGLERAVSVAADRVGGASVASARDVLEGHERRLTVIETEHHINHKLRRNNEKVH